MKIKSILANKYTVSVLFLLSLVLGDILWHRGMTRVMLPGRIIEKRDIGVMPRCDQRLLSKEKKWKKAVNTIEQINQLESNVPGFEIDVYFDTARNCFEVYHDSARYSSLDLAAILGVYKSKQLTASIWLDFKNLSAYNALPALRSLSALRDTYALQHKLIIESSSPQYLQPFCDSNFFTSYYIPFFNPYRMSKKDLLKQLDHIDKMIHAYPVSALSGYYFQYPALKNYFPNHPILTWTDNAGLSPVANLFNNKLLQDAGIKVILFPG